MNHTEYVRPPSTFCTLPADLIRLICEQLPSDSLIVLSFASKSIRMRIGQHLGKVDGKFWVGVLETIFRHGYLSLIRWCESYLKFPIYEGYFPLRDSLLYAAAQGGQIEVLKTFSPSTLRRTSSHLCEQAAGHGQLETLKYLRAIGAPWNGATAASATEYNHLEVLKWILCNGLSFDELRADLFDAAACGGHISVLQWLLENGLAKTIPYNVPSLVASRGHIHVLEWLRARLWDFHFQLSAQRLYTEAAQGGQLAVIRWLESNGSHVPDDAIFGSAAAALGSRELMEYAISKGFRLSHKPTQLSLLVIRTGNLSFIKWLSEEHGLRFDYSCGREAACLGDLEILTYLHSKDCELLRFHFAAAARHGRMDLAKWFLDNGGEPTEGVCSEAAASGNLELLQFLRQSQVPWDDLTCTYAAGNGHLRILKWARENGCHWSPSTLEAAARSGRFAAARWALENDCPCSKGQLILEAATSGHIAMVRWLRDQEFPWSPIVYERAATYGRWDLVQWLLENSAPIDAETAAAVRGALLARDLEDGDMERLLQERLADPHT